jgi:signal transduction histidine kinase
MNDFSNAATVDSFEQEESEDLQRFIELGRLSATLLHEISSPLTAALIHLDQVNDQKSSNVRAIKRSLKYATNYVNAARQQLRTESSTSTFYFHSQLNDVKRLVIPLARKANVDLTIDKAPHLKIGGDRIKFQQVLVNLIVNAIEAYPDCSQRQISSRSTVRVRIIYSLTNLNIQIIDYGQGISKEQLPKLFEPFYTTKSKSGKGLGLGLVIVRQYVTQNFNGQIKVTSSATKGTCFSIKIPLIVKQT